LGISRGLMANIMAHDYLNVLKGLWDVQDSNQRPHACEACALNRLS
jgi:hypothetical protein